MPDSDQINHHILFDLPRERRMKYIGRNLATAALVAGLIGCAGRFAAFPAIIWMAFGLFFIALIILSFYTMTVRIVADDEKITWIPFLGRQRSIAFSAMTGAGIYLASRGPTRMLQFTNTDGKALNIYGTTITEGQLRDIQDFVANRCLEVTGKPIKLKRVGSKDTFIPDTASGDSSDSTR